jgi:hypothetical protein
VHEVLLALDLVPNLQGVEKGTVVEAQKLPAGHELQVELPGNEYSPVAQLVEVFEVHFVPPAHIVHSVFLVAEFVYPSLHV